MWHTVPGGSATSIIGLLQGLTGDGDFGLDLIGVAAKHDEPPEESLRPPIEVRHLNLPRRLVYLTWQHFGWPDIEAATGRVDVTHATTLAVPGTIAPLVVTVQDLAFLHEPDHFTRNGLRFFDRGVKRTLRHADLVVVPSEATAEDCRSIGLRDDRLRIVPWGIDPTPVTDVEVEAVRQRWQIDKPYVLFVGTIEPRKNLPRVVEAFSRMASDTHCLVIVGWKGWKEDLGSIIETSDADVRPLGYVPGDDLPALYRGADVCCAPSLREGFGMPVLEAMTQATPVVTSAGTSTAEVAGDTGVLVDPLDVDAISEGLQRAIDERDELGAAGLRRSEQFSLHATAQGYADVYAEAAAGERRGR